jgi:hypothetical protein
MHCSVAGSEPCQINNLATQPFSLSVLVRGPMTPSTAVSFGSRISLLTVYMFQLVAGFSTVSPALILLCRLRL